MSLIIKDGAGSTTALSTSLIGGEHTPYHAISGTVNITGNVGINADTYTNNGVDALYVKVSGSSVSDRIYVAVDADKYAYPGSTLGALVTKITASDPNAPLYVSASQTSPVYVTGNISGEVEVSNAQNTALWVTSSFASPVYVTSSNGKELYVTNTSTTPIYVTSSQASPVVTKNAIATITVRNTFSSFASTINWAGTGSSNISGTFILAQTSSVRKGLMFANNTNKDLYVALGDTDFAATNGFLLASTASAPSYYSFIIYPSGTYFAEQAFVNLKHSGFFVSSSNIDVQISSVTTE